MDKVLVGTVPGGRRFFAVEREGRRMPLLNERGEVAFWTKKEAYAGMYSQEGSEFARVLLAMDRPERLKVVSSGRG